jgi:hypothetical protein
MTAPVPSIEIRITRRDAHPVTHQDFHLIVTVGPDIPDGLVERVTRAAVLQIRRGMEQRPDDPVTVSAHSIYAALRDLVIAHDREAMLLDLDAALKNARAALAKIAAL